MSSQVPSSQIKWELKKFPLVVIVENIHSPSNVGLVIRTCESLGVKDLFFTGSHSNIHSNKFRKAARSAEKYLSIHVKEDSSALLEELKLQLYKIVALEISCESNNLQDLDFHAMNNVALMIGSERHGISPESLAASNFYAHIQQYGKTGSLNVSTALSIALYEITNQLK